MTHTSHPIRPARAAIAAVLALTATPLLAQEAPATTPVMPLPEAMQPASPTGTATLPSQTPQVQMPMAQPTAPATPPPAGTPPAASMPGDPMPMAIPVAPPMMSNAPPNATTPPAEAAERPAPIRRAAPAERPAIRNGAAPVPTATAPEITEPEIARPDLAATPPQEAADLTPVAPVAPAIETPARQDAAVSGAQTGSGDVWGWMAGLLALLGLGGGAIALRRTRTRKSAAMMADARSADADYDRRLAGPHDRPQATTVTTPVPAPSTARFDQPLMQTSAVTPMAQARPAPRRTPVAPHSDMTVDERRLEELIAQPPSRANPFRTRANRKRRALFLLRTSYAMQSAA